MLYIDSIWNKQLSNIAGIDTTFGTNTNFYVAPATVNYTTGASTIGYSEFQYDVVPAPQEKLKLPVYPHSNAYIDNDDKGTLILEFAVAGYKKENISVLVTKTNQLTIKGDPSKVPEKREMLVSKISNRQFEVALQFDEAYSLENAKVKVEDGILTISIPRSIEHSIKKLL
jgi:HSP20 family molecular chaperone IbpA